MTGLKHFEGPKYVTAKPLCQEPQLIQELFALKRQFDKDVYKMIL